MNIRFFSKLASVLCLLSLLSPAHSTAHAQATNAVIDQQYDIQIINGNLMLDPLKSHVSVKALWGSPDSQVAVPPTVEHLVTYLRAAHTNLNIVLSPAAKDVQIGDLKFRSDDMPGLAQALYIATDGAIQGKPLSGKDNWAFIAPQGHKSDQSVEVFNLTGYLEVLNTHDEKVIQQKLADLEDITLETLRHIRQRQGSENHADNDPQFRFHEGTGLLIVMGPSDAIDVARKIVNALPGQHKLGAREDLLDISTNRNQN